MAGFIEGANSGQTLFSTDRLEDWIGEHHIVRLVDLFVEVRDPPGLGPICSTLARTGRRNRRSAVRPALLIYGERNQFPASRRLDRDAKHRELPDPG
jgi:hypothetical protein